MSNPDFLCIGAQKAGTTWLHSMLDQRPDIHMGPFKETHFFNHRFIPEHRKWTRWHVRMGVKKALKEHLRTEGAPNHSYLALLSELVDPKLMFSDEWYKRFYSHKSGIERICGDITPEYCALPAHGISYLKEFCRTPKIIYIIRDPYQRALSQLRMAASRKYKNKRIGIDWLSLVDGTPIMHRGDYRSYIPNWESIFGTENILYIPFKDISKNSKAVMTAVESHLGLSPFTYSVMSSRVHATRSARIPRKARRQVEVLVQDQYPFLRSRFGEEFLNRI